MEITNKNFKEMSQLVKESIEDAVFIAIDGEFTGLRLGGEEPSPSDIDTAEERYAKVRASTSKFLLIQFGLCTFHRDGKTGKYTNRGFNFYVWPRHSNRGFPDPRFTCQTSSIDFLASHKFDFNKLFIDGIPYLKAADERRVEQDLLEKKNRRNEESGLSSTPSTPVARRDAITVPEDQKSFVEGTLKQIEEYLNNGLEKDPLELPQCNGFQRKLLYQTVKSKFDTQKQGLFMETVVKNCGERAIVVSKVNEEEWRERAARKDESELRQLEESVGFCRVIQKISESKKLVVGHNMLLDLCHTVNQFVDSLPETLSEFKDLMTETFPNVCDTKLMATTSPFKENILNSSLEELLKALDEKPFSIPDVDSDYGCTDHRGYALGKSVEKFHEAGYDAYVTGLCFLAMSNRLKHLFERGAGDAKEYCCLPSDFKHVSPFVNKVWLNIPDIPYLNLTEDDIKPGRDNVFHVTFPADWERMDINQLFYTFGPLKVSFLTKTTAFVSLKDRVEPPSVVMSKLNCTSVYRVVPYKQFKRMQQLKVADNGTGITPSMEKVTMTIPSNKASLVDCEEASRLSGGGGGEKRPVAPNKDRLSKRSKVGSYETSKVFEEPPWE